MLLKWLVYCIQCTSGKKFQNSSLKLETAVMKKLEIAVMCVGVSESRAPCAHRVLGRQRSKKQF